MPYICQLTSNLGNSDVEAIFTTLNAERMAGYLEATKGDKSKALVLYALNQSLSSLLFELIGNIEVALRNKIHDAFRVLYNRPDWFGDVQAKLTEKGATKRAANIAQAIEELEGNGEHLSSGKIIAKLSFGFWVALFESKYNRLFWRNSLYRLFPSGTALESLHDQLVLLRDTRNSIAHHERIYYKDIAKVLDTSTETLTALCPSMMLWSHGRIRAEVENCLTEIKNFLS